MSRISPFAALAVNGIPTGIPDASSGTGGTSAGIEAPFRIHDACDILTGLSQCQFEVVGLELQLVVGRFVEQPQDLAYVFVGQVHGRFFRALMSSTMWSYAFSAGFAAGAFSRFAQTVSGRLWSR